jgi:5'/3'-nucleotidase SurE
MTVTERFPWIGVTTDDGVRASGFRSLVADLTETGWHIEAVAPKRRWVSYGTALGTDPARLLNTPVSVKTRGIEVLDLPPAAVVRHICQRANEKRTDPRVRPCVVVGVNHGPNVGENLIHSGTFGETIVASWLGFSAVAVSLDDTFSVNEAHPGPLRFQQAARIARFAVNWVLSCRRPVLCNINVPNSVCAEEVRIEAAMPHNLACDGIGLQLDHDVLRQGKVAVSAFAGGSFCVSESLSRRAAHAIAAHWQLGW